MMKHTRLDHSEEQVPTISYDYGFLGDESAAANELPILVCKDRFSKCIWAFPVPSKRVDHDHGWRCLLGVLRETGYRKVTLKGDQEPSIRAVIREAATAHRLEVLTEFAPKEAHERSNG